MSERIGMKFDRLKLLSEKMADYSLKLEVGERCLVAAGHSAMPLVNALAETVLIRGAVPVPYFMDEGLTQLSLRALSLDDTTRITETMTTLMAPLHRLLEGVEAVVVIRSKETDTPFAGVAEKVVEAYQQHIGRAFNCFTNQKKWVVFDWPTPHQAGKAGMIYEEFFNFVMDLSLVDYSAMYQAALPAKQILDAADQVRITGVGTDLRFSKKGINTIIGAAENSYPDGELYTAPIRDSVEGFVTFNVPSIYLGNTFEGIRLLFNHGKIVQATCEQGDEAALNAILSSDEGASYIGEFALGINPDLDRPMNDIHYDEKIAGSFHFTPGNCYDDAYNGNRSAIHWDMVCMQDKVHGGGEIWLDGKLLRKDGQFVMDGFRGLNSSKIRGGGF